MPVNQPLLLYLSPATYAPKNLIAATLAWLADKYGSLFEVYYDAYRIGEHYGGGNPEYMPPGMLNGGLFTGSHHLEQLGLLLQSFAVCAVLSGQVAFRSLLMNQQIPMIGNSTDIGMLYRQVFAFFGAAFPSSAVLIPTSPTAPLDGLDAYYYPEIVQRQALGLPADSADTLLQDLQAEGLQTLVTFGLEEARIEQLRQLGFAVECGEVAHPQDSYGAATERIARRWLPQANGWLVADPTVVSSWLPTAIREQRLAIYSIPQSMVLMALKDEVLKSSLPVIGRQYEDKDFFTLSCLGQSFQLVDPVRPAFPVIESAPYHWSNDVPDLEGAEPDDAQLRSWAQEGRVLSSLVFWTGMIRELENLYRLMDLVALTRLKAGLVITTESLRYMRYPPLELVTIPLSQGGVFPCIELLLGSCGTGAAIESILPAGSLALHLSEARKRLSALGIPPHWQPKGWWPTMDAVLERCTRWNQPAPLALHTTAPYLHIRYHKRPDYPPAVDLGSHKTDGSTFPSPANVRNRTGKLVRNLGLQRFFDPYRPYEFFAPGSIRQDIPAAVAGQGLEYMLSKSGFAQPPKVLYSDSHFIAINYTAGRWDGWTPFETISSVGDLISSERRLVGRKQPGWLLGTLDTCLWAFSGPVWKRGHELQTIAQWVSKGGASGRLVNVTPHTIARYARLVEQTRSEINHTTLQR